MVVRTVIQRGPKEKRAVAFAVDWPGWSRGGKTPDDALELLETYRDRYRPIARLAGLDAEFEAAGALELVEDHVGVGSTDFWGISFAPSSFELASMPEGELERKLALLEAAWQFFDGVAARVSPKLERGPRGGGRDRDEIVRHVVGNEQHDLARRIGVLALPDDLQTLDGIGSHHEEFIAAMRDYNAQGKMARGRNWTIPLLLRHTAFHVLDHAWEMEDKDLSSDQRPDARESARGSAPPS